MRPGPILPRRTLVCAPLFIALLLGPAMANGRGMNPWDVARLKNVASVAVSPDGGRIAYTLSVPRDPMSDENGPVDRELHVYDRRAQRTQAFVVGKVHVSHVSFTADGRYLGYLAKRGDDENPTLYVIALAGGESRRLVRWPEEISDYAFGPSGRRVAFLAKQKKDEDREALKEKGFDMEVYEERARPTQLFLVDVDLDDASAEPGEPVRVEIDDHLSDLQWAPSGEHLLVSVAPTSRIDDRYVARHFAVVDAAAGRFVGHIDTEGKLGAARLSPDGSQVAFVGAVDLHDPSAGRLMVAPATGGAPKMILGPEFLGAVRAVRWIDSQNLLFLADRGTHSFVGRIRSRGGKVREVVAADHPVLTSFDLSADGRILAAVGDAPTHPAELFAGRVGKALERLTDSNPWLGEIELAEQRVFEWEARDGLRIEGILMQPLHREEGERVPLVVVVHGGPESHERDGWKTVYSRGGQFLASEGFAVFYPNYRGSTGRGVDFSLSSQGDPGGAEFEDVVDGIDALVAGGLVDEDRVGITGGSYGGYATAWGATYYSERYAAAVMFVGISEQIAKFGTTDIPLESQLVHQYPKKVYDDWDFFRERSPIFHARGSTTPLLILHGKADPRVHPTQSMIMYRYYQHLAEAPVRLVWYPGEGHGNRKAAGRLDYSLRLLRWMKHYLVDGGGEMPPFDLDYDAAIEEMKG